MMLATVAIMMVQAAQPADVTGFYMSRTMEVGSAIALDPNGEFMFGLDYGAISERAQGKWVREGDIVYLTATEHQTNWDESPKFERTSLRIDGNNLWLQRYGREIRFEKEAELPVPQGRNKELED